MKIGQDVVQPLVGKVTLGENLPTTQQIGARALLKDFPQLNLRKPLISYGIVLKPQCPVQKGFSRIPEWLQEIVKKEVQSMLDKGEAEESSSDWKSLC